MSSISEQELARLQDSFDRLADDMNQHSAFFYDALFRRAPDLRALFREDIEGQGMRFMRTLGVILAKLRDPDAISSQYSDLGEKHRLLGIVQAQFAPMEEALIDTIRNALGEDLTPELEDLWRRAYGEISATMIRRGDIPAS